MDRAEDERWRALERAHQLTVEAIRSRALKRGDHAPDLIFGGPPGSELRLSKFLARGPVVLIFQRGTWCPYCTAKLRVLGQNLLPVLQSTGARLLVVTPEGSCCRSDVESGACMPEGSISIADQKGDIARAFGLLAPMDNALKQAYASGFGLVFDDDSEALGLELPVPASYVVRQDGTIAYGKVDSEVAGDFDFTEILEVLRSLDD